MVVTNRKIDDQRIKKVDCFKYLQSNTENGRSLIDVKSRIVLAKDAFNRRKELFTKGLSQILKKRMAKWQVVLYGCATCIMNARNGNP